MSNLINFNFENQSITTATSNDGEIFFRASELATALGFGNPRQAISTHVDNDDLQKLDIACDVQELDGTSKARKTQKVNFVNESGMYALIFGSTKAEAKRFKKWVTSEVLPSIRKNGAYQQQNLAITHQSERPFNIGDYLNPKVNQIMDYVHDLEHIVFNTTGKYPQRPFKPDEIAKGIIGYCLRNQSIELSFSERGLGFNLVDRTMLRIHDSNIAEHIKNGNVKKQYLDEIIQASVARLA